MATWKERQRKQYEEFQKNQGQPVKKSQQLLEQWVNPKDASYERWEQDRAERVAKSDLDASLGLPSRDRMNLSYGPEYKEPKTTQPWQSAFLKDLPIKEYGRSYNEKFRNWAREQGIPDQMHHQFRTWLNASDQRLKSDAWEATEGYKYKEPSIAKEKEAPQKELTSSVQSKPEQSFGNKILDFLKKGGQHHGQGSNAEMVQAAKKGVLPESYDRFDSRIANSQSFGLVQNQMLRDLKDNPTPEKQAEYERLFGESESGSQKAVDVTADLLGYLSPGIAGSMGIRAGMKAAGKELGKGSLKKTAAELAAEGALIGGGIGAGEVAVREALNPEDTDWKENLAHIGINTAAGAVLDPALSLAAPAARHLMRKTASDAVGRAAMGQVDTALKSGDYESLSEFMKQGYNPRPTNPIEDILSGRATSPTSVQNPLGQLGELSPNVSTRQALKELTDAPKRATLPSTAKPKVQFDPEAPFESKMDYFRDKSNPITEAEIPHVFKMMDELETKISETRNNPAMRQAVEQMDSRYANASARLEELHIAQKEAVDKLQLWDEVKKLQELYKPANRPEYYKFKIPENARQDYRDVPKRFRSAKDASLHIDEAASMAGYDNVDAFVDHLVSLDNALATKRKSLGIPENNVLKGFEDEMKQLQEQQDSIFNEFTGLKDMEQQLDELVEYSRPRQPQSSDPFENVRKIIVGKDTPAPQQAREVSDPYGDGALDDDFIEQLIRKQKKQPMTEHETLETVMNEPKEKMPKASKSNIVLGADDVYADTGMASVPKTADRAADKVKSMPEELRKFRENFDSSIQSAKELEKLVTQRLSESQTADIITMLPEGSNTRAIAQVDNFAKQLQELPKATAKAVRSYQKGYKPVFDILKKNNIPRENFEEYALSKHAIDIYENNADKAIRRGELMEELERIEAERISSDKPQDLDKLEQEILSELDTLEPYKLPKSMNEEKARHVVKQYEKYEGMQEAHALFIKEQQRDLYALYKSGQHTLAEIEAMMKANPNYVSLKRNVPDSTNIFNYVSPKKSKTPIRARGLGSEEYEILPVLDSAFNNRLDTFNAVARNDAINTLEKWAKVEGMQDLVRRISPLDPRFPKVAKNTLKGYKDGQEVYYEVPPFISEMMNFHTSGIKDDVSMRALKAVATVFKRGTTNWNPQFHIKSALRDTTQALANSRTDAKMHDMAAGFLDSFFGPQLSKLTGGRFKSYKEVYKDMGGEMAGFVSQDMYSVHRMTEALRKGTLGGYNVLNPFKYIEQFGMTMEHGARLGEFRSAKKKGYSDADASFEATDIIDYSDQGRVTRALNPYDPYLSATIRGNVRTLQAMRNNPKQFAKVGLTFVTAPTVMLYASRYASTTSNEQRAKIENMPTWQKNTFWAIPVPNTDSIMLMPKPFILGQMFANPIERMLDRTFADKNKPITQDVVDTFADIQNVGMPPMTIAGLTTGFELMANKDFFSKFPIESQSMQGKPAAERYDSYTSEVAKKIGQFTGHEAIPEEAQISPAKVDHVLKKAGGTLGRQGLDVLDNILAEGGTRPKRTETTGQILNPLGALIYKDTSASGLYNRISKQAEKDSKKWREENPDKLRTKVKDRPQTSAQKAYMEMKALNDEIAEIRDSDKFTAKEKNEMISELRTRQKLIGSEFIRN